MFENSLSKDLAHTNSFETVAKEKNNLIFLGNSLTREGIDQQLLLSKLKIKKNGENKVGYLYPDDTSIFEWYYIFNSYFFNSEFYPKQLIIIFALDQLETENFEFEEIQRISRYLSFGNSIDFIKKENLSVSQTINFYLSKISKTYSNRERIRKRILDIIPNYRSTIRSLNKSTRFVNNYKNSEKEYSHLNKLVQLVDSLKISTKFCVIPLPNEFVIDSNIVLTLDKSSYCQLINFQDTLSFGETDFIDGYHLNKKGATKFTSKLAKIIHAPD